MRFADARRWKPVGTTVRAAQPELLCCLDLPQPLLVLESRITCYVPLVLSAAPGIIALGMSELLG